MRRWFLMALSAAIVVVGYAQQTKMSEHPAGTTGNHSAYRYNYNAWECPPAKKDPAIPVSITRQKLCELVESPLLNKQVEAWVDLALPQAQGICKSDVYVSYLEVCRESMGPPHFGHYNGNEMQYASSFAKVFYATALYYELQQNKIKMTDGLTQDVIKMLHENDNDATNRIVDYMSGTNSGPTLAYPEYCDFAKKRDYTNWYFNCIGFQNFNVNQKMWTSAPAASDVQLLGEKLPLNYENSNRVTANQMAALLYLIDCEVIVSPCAGMAIKQYMYRPLEQRKLEPLAGISGGLPVGTKLIGMTGYTAGTFNEAGIVTLPNHKQYVLVVMTKYQTYPTFFIPLLSRIIANAQMTSTGDDNLSDDYLEIRPVAGSKGN